MSILQISHHFDFVTKKEIFKKVIILRATVQRDSQESPVYTFQTMMKEKSVLSVKK